MGSSRQTSAEERSGPGADVWTADLGNEWSWKSSLGLVGFVVLFSLMAIGGPLTVWVQEWMSPVVPNPVAPAAPAAAPVRTNDPLLHAVRLTRCLLQSRHALLTRYAAHVRVAQGWAEPPACGRKPPRLPPAPDGAVAPKTCEAILLKQPDYRRLPREVPEATWEVLGPLKKLADTADKPNAWLSRRWRARACPDYRQLVAEQLAKLELGHRQFVLVLWHHFRTALDLRAAEPGKQALVSAVTAARQLSRFVDPRSDGDPGQEQALAHFVRTTDALLKPSGSRGADTDKSGLLDRCGALNAQLVRQRDLAGRLSRQCPLLARKGGRARAVGLSVACQKLLFDIRGGSDLLLGLTVDALLMWAE